MKKLYEQTDPAGFLFILIFFVLFVGIFNAIFLWHLSQQRHEGYVRNQRFCLGSNGWWTEETSGFLITCRNLSDNTEFFIDTNGGRRLIQLERCECKDLMMYEDGNEQE